MSRSPSPPLNALSAQTISRLAAESFPKGSSTQLRNADDAIALATHAAMLAVDFRLVGLGEDHRIETPSDRHETQPLPAEWNAQPGSYAFRYRHGQSSADFLININRMGRKAIIMGLAVGDDRTHHAELNVDEYVSADRLPLELRQDLAADDRARRVTDCFLTAGRLGDFGSLMQTKLIQKLAPFLQKEATRQASPAYTRRPPPGREGDTPQRDALPHDRNPPPARPYPHQGPRAQPGRPRAPIPEPIPGFEDEFELQRPPRGMQPGGFPRYGDRDLYPQGLGPNDPLRGGVGPGLGGWGGGGGGGGMHPTFDDPLFAGQGQRGPGFDPQAPPGARFDPPFGPGQGGHPRGAGMGGRPPNSFGGFGDGDFI